MRLIGLSPPTPHPLAPLWLQANGWDQFPGLVHGFSGRLQDRAAALSGPGMASFALCTLRQVHGDDIVVVDRRDTWDERPEADGMITAETGILLGITTADCVPVLIVEPEKGLVAALHAGWRGTLKGISGRVVEALVTGWGVDPQRLWALNKYYIAPQLRRSVDAAMRLAVRWARRCASAGGRRAARQLGGR